MDATDTNSRPNEWKKGWMIVLSAFFIEFVTEGLVFSFGIMLVEMIDYFGEGRAITGTTLSIVAATQHLVGPLSGALAQKYGHRIIVVSGALMSCTGFVLSSFATNIYHFWISYGLLGGIGTFVFNYCLRLLIDHFGWRGTCLLEAGFVLQGVIFGLLLSGWKKKENVLEEENTSFGSSVKSFLSSVFRLELLKDKGCIMFLLSTSTVSIAFLIPFTFIPDQVEEAGMTKTEAAMLTSSIGIANTVSRVIFGWIGDRICFSTLTLLVVLILLNGLLTGLSPLMSTFETKLVYTTLFGTLIGGYVALLTVVLVGMVKPELTANAFGLAQLSIGIGVIAATPTAGFLFDQTGVGDI